MSKVSDNILKRVYLLLGGIAVLSIGIVYRVVQIQYFQGEHWIEEVENGRITERTLQAERGSILAYDGTVLVQTQSFYMLSIDPSRVDTSAESGFRAKLDTLARNLEAYFNHPSYSYEANYDRILRAVRPKANGHVAQYLSLHPKPVDFEDYQMMKTWPLLRKGKYAGGLLNEKRSNFRHFPRGNLGRITLGVLDEEGRPRKGLEYAFDEALKGKDRKVMMQRVAAGAYVPLEEYGDVEAENGASVITTLDLNIQEAAYKAIADAVETHDAKWGVALVMEVETGDLRAVANYPENINRAVARLVEPGSTMKLASAMMLLEDGHIRPGDSIETGNGVATFYDMTIRDHIAMGKIDFREAFEHSSNVAFAQLMFDHYSHMDQLGRYFKHLERFHLTDPTGLQIVGEPSPIVYRPEDADNWSGTSLPSMAIGYSMRLTPLQVLAFYNGVANNGRLVRPRLVSEVREGSQVMEEFEVETLNKRLCSERTLKWLHEMMYGVVERGTAREIKGSPYGIAGKTATAKKVVDGHYRNIYQASFAGYFPADNPKYSIYVLVDEPSKGQIYGGSVAAPVVRQIADDIYALDLELAQEPKHMAGDGPVAMPSSRAIDGGNARRFYTGLELSSPAEGDEAEGLFVSATPEGRSVAFDPMPLESGKVPDVRGMSAKDALTLLETLGLRVQLDGFGRVQRQTIRPGAAIEQGSTITLKLN